MGSFVLFCFFIMGCYFFVEYEVEGGTIFFTIDRDGPSLHDLILS